MKTLIKLTALSLCVFSLSGCAVAQVLGQGAYESAADKECYAAINQTSNPGSSCAVDAYDRKDSAEDRATARKNKSQSSSSKYDLDLKEWDY